MIQKEEDSKPIQAKLVSSGELSTGQEGGWDVNLDKNPNELRAKIIKIAKNLIDDHHTLNTHALYLQSLRILKGTSKHDIENTINRLLKEKTLFEGKSLTKDVVLENKIRSLIWNIIKDLPGITFSRIRKFVKKGNRVIDWHLRVLKRFDYIRIKTINDRKHYFDFFAKKNNEIVYILLHKSKIMQIWEAIRKNPGIKTRKLIRVLDIPRSTLFRKLNHMSDHGLINVNQNKKGAARLEVNIESKEVVIAFIWRARNWTELSTIKQD